ncbi:hypothetical protein BKA70DRAFT_1435665 [Coprinopsis sp. MPI-PUGE-AT-0042]|nr:hypothetical protein BKA70DRAFT_1435665 [Coprinopsis sp. MPI-PUGE-AT-0042]
MAGPTARGGFILFCAFLLAIVTLSTAQTRYLPVRSFFLDDTPVQSVIYHDGLEGDALVSEDKDKTWTQAEGLFEGEITNVFEHP